MQRLMLAAILALVVGFLGFALMQWKSAADVREILLQTDRDFDQATAEKGIEGWVSYFAEDGSMFPAGGDIITGKAVTVRRLDILPERF